MAQQPMPGGPGVGDESLLLCRVFVPHLNLKKTIRIDPNDAVWELKLKFIEKMSLEVDKEEDPYNFGIYLPKAGVYLDEQRLVSSYYFSDNVYFEFKRKAREQKLPEKQVQKMNNEKTQKQFYDYQTARQYKKMRDMLDKGFDPNFIYRFNGETPMTLACISDDVEGIVLFYSNGGAFVDYRSADGKTPLHKAASKGKFMALKTLLKHGASANVRDKQNLTALYDACVHGKVKCADALLQANSPLGFKDASNRSELHHACNFNTPELVELLIMFGAEMTAVNELGNSPLHVCASKGTIDCARVLLKKGANKDAVNAASNTPYQVAVMFNNHELAEVINSFKPEEVEAPVLVQKDKVQEVLFDDDPVVENYYIPAMPPAGSVGICAAPADAPARRRVYQRMPPPPPPVENYFGQGMANDDTADAFSMMTTDLVQLSSLPPPPPMDMGSLGLLPPPPPEVLQNISN